MMRVGFDEMTIDDDAITLTLYLAYTLFKGSNKIPPLAKESPIHDSPLSIFPPSRCWASGVKLDVARRDERNLLIYNLSLDVVVNYIVNSWF